MENILLTIRHLYAWYQREQMVLSDLSLELRQNEAVGLIGLNGAGKTTLLKILSGLHENFRLEDAGFSVNFREKAFKRRRYTVFAEDHSFGYFTFREYLSYAAAAYHKAPQGVEELVRGFHFNSYENVLLKELSTGNQKKAFLITAFALKPELLLLDEPVNGLDFQSTEFLYGCLEEYKKQGTVLFASHILESITLTADRVLVLEQGRISRQFEKDEMDAALIRKALYGENGFRCQEEAEHEEDRSER